MRRVLKRTLLHTLRSSGAFAALRDSRWRRNRLLILCYHGVSRYDEHLWRPGLYMTPAVLEDRLRALKQGGYQVLPLGVALQKLKSQELPPRSTVLTFDDGGCDFFSQAAPILRKYSFPVTVYQSTYYTEVQKPIFNLICSYMLWTRHGKIIPVHADLGLGATLDTRTEQSRSAIVEALEGRCRVEGLNGRQKDDVARMLASVLQIDYDLILERRCFHLMTPEEIRQLSTEGVDFQLHTHRHRAPDDEALFRKEIQDNRQVLEALTGNPAAHFCYPSGVYRPEFLRWLEAEGVVSATTCDPALATADSDMLMLPRFVDTSAKTPIEFESWLTGAGSLLTLRRTASQYELSAG